MKRSFRDCALYPADQAIVDAARAVLAAVRNPQPWTPGGAQDVAGRVGVGPFVERAHTRPGDDYGPDLISVALVHPDAPYAAAHFLDRQLRYTDHGWLRCEMSETLGFWQQAYAMLTHAAAGLPLPDDVGMDLAHYALYVEVRRRDDSLDAFTLLHLGPYTQTRHAQQDFDRLTAALEGRETTAVPGFRISARYAPSERQRPPAVRRSARGRRRGAPERRHRGSERVTAPALYEIETSESDDGTRYCVEWLWTPGEDAANDGFVTHRGLCVAGVGTTSDDDVAYPSCAATSTRGWRRTRTGQDLCPEHTGAVRSIPPS
ncbi:hypothetical protein AB0B15_24675 [Streptomyces sp. NPDC045456]|uniref:hypothetical protein n=1 Tax=Streptomyces sp. NPDC045456 TaxID=3155254 RepID=UPI0033FF9E87